MHLHPKDKAIKSVIENKSLTDKQRLFCLHYSRSFNATRSYQKAYGCSYATALTNGPELLGNTRVRDEITKLKEQRYTQALLRPEDIFQKYMDIAFSDLTDYLDWGQEEVPVTAVFGPVVLTDPETGEKTPLMKTVNVVRFKGSDEVDGSILSEVKQGKDGASIKLADRMKALEWLADHLDLATEEQKARIAQIKANTARISDGGTGEDDGVIIDYGPKSVHRGSGDPEADAGLPG